MFADTLIETRKRLGYVSARSFFMDLDQKGNLDFNYSYYARIESGKVLPSEKVINTIAKLIPPKEGNLLILSFCQDLFPERSFLFEAKVDQNPQVVLPQKTRKETPPEKVSLKRGEKLLTLRQVAALSETKEHYFMFLLSDLARGAIPVSQIDQLFSEKIRDRILKSLQSVKLLRIENGLVLSMSQDLKFPPREPGKLTEIYAHLDHWDREFSNFFRFERLTQRFILKRVSPRFFSLLLSQSQMLIDLVNAAEDTDPQSNDEVMMFQLRVTHGKVPG